MDEDVLSWEKFYEESKKRRFYPPKKAELFNRLIAHTNNFFAISAIGAFSKGYVLVITKKLLPSYALVDQNQIEELNWFINVLTKCIKKAYNRDSVIFEHGMCACVGGLDRAHLHILSIDSKSTSKIIIKSINNILKKRKAGIKYIKYKGYKLENIHDINEIINSSSKGSYKVFGKQLNYNDIKNDLNYSKWPLAAINHVKKGGHYVFFKVPSKIGSFLTNKNFNTQIGREIVCDIELRTNKKLKLFEKKTLVNNPYANLWKWQEFPFKDNMIITMRDMAPFLTEIRESTLAKIYNFKTFEIKQ